MTRANTEIKRIKSKTSYGPMPYGQFAGQPTVSIKLSSSDSNGIKVQSLQNVFNSRKWEQKITSGYARLRIYGDNPFHERHRESLEYLFDVFDPRFIDVELEDKYINEEPSTYIKRKIDTYTFVIDATRDEPRYDIDTLNKISNDYASSGNAQYIFKADTVMCEDYIRKFTRDYKVYDSEVWLYPKGRKASTVYENREPVETVAKRNTWNVSPRMGVELDEQDSGSD